MSLTPFWTTTAILVLAVGFITPSIVPTAPGAGRGTTVPSGFPGPGSGLPGILPNDHIQHVITVIMENHDYDSYFGTYCLTKGTYCSDTGNGIPSGTCVPRSPGNISFGCVTPYNLTPRQFILPDMPHDWLSGPEAYNHGQMNGFYNAEGTVNAFGHYNQTTIPIYWDMAEEYASSDNFWAANLSYSLPNHWFLLAGQAPPISSDSWLKNVTDRSTYRNESNVTTSVEDLLAKNPAVSWAYYDNALLPEAQSFAQTGFGTAYDYWNPLAGKASTYLPSTDAHFLPRIDILPALANGTLPNISWVIPDTTSSDHPGFNNSLGESWVAQLVNSVESSKFWSTTAIFLTWDDYGGWYDHVAPPTILRNLLSFRSPLIVISPFARENYISHVPLNFFSLLHFVEWQFGLGCITVLDCLAPLPLDLLNFNQAVRPSVVFAGTWNTAQYPMPLQGAAPLNQNCTSCLTINDSLWVNPPTPPFGYDTTDLS